MHSSAVHQEELRKRAQTRMQDEGISQRALASRLGVSQGHLSKVLRFSAKRPTRASRALEEWLASTERGEDPDMRTDLPKALVRATLVAVGGSELAMQIATEVMHLLGQMRQVGKRSDGARGAKGRKNRRARRA